MKSLDTNEETVHNQSNNQLGSAENSHSLSVQHETAARDQQYVSIVDTGYEHLTAQYEVVHNSTLEHICEVVSQVNLIEGRLTADRLVNNVDDDGYWQLFDEHKTQVNQLESRPAADRCANNVDKDGYWQVLDEQATPVNQVEGRPTADRWVNNVDDDGYWQVLNDEQSVALDAERYLQVLNNDDLALSEQPCGYNQRVRRAARVDSYGYLQPVVKNKAEVRALPLVSLNSHDITATEPDTCIRLHSLYTASNATTPNPLYTAPDDTQPNPLYSAPDDTPPNPLYSAPDNTLPDPLYSAPDDTLPDPLYTVPDDTPPTALYTVHNHENRPRLPTPRVNSQLTSNTTSVDLKLPVRPHSFKKQRLCLVIVAPAVIIATVAWLIIYYCLLYHDKGTISQYDATVSVHLGTAKTLLPQLTLQPLVEHSLAPARIQVKSAKYKSSFTVNSTNGHYITVLSVSSVGQLLVGQKLDRQLHVYSANCCQVTSITLPHNDTVYDAVLTRRGNIVYTACNTEKVVLMSQSGVVIQQNPRLWTPSTLSVSTNGIIYLLTDDRHWVSHSKSDGLTWGIMFSFGDTFFQVINVSLDPDEPEVLWTIVESFGGHWRLRVYIFDRRRSDGDTLLRRDVIIPSHVTVTLNNSRLAYDGHTSVLVADRFNRAVHVWSVSGEYDRQLVSPQQLPSDIQSVAVDTQRHVMYVSDVNGTVSTFELTYEPL